MLAKLFALLYRSPIATLLVKTTRSELQAELLGCDSVLDIGCGPDSPLQYCSNVSRKVGVEVFQPYLLRAKESGTHDELHSNSIFECSFPDEAFDAVILIDVLEHFSREDGERIIALAKAWAKHKVIVSSPNGFVKQKAIDGNPYQEHLSGWTMSDLHQQGFSSFKGLAGLKVLRCEVESDSMNGDLLATIRWRPKLFWFLVGALSQVMVYRYPKLAFSLFSVLTKR